MHEHEPPARPRSPHKGAIWTITKRAAPKHEPLQRQGAAYKTRPRRSASARAVPEQPASHVSARGLASHSAHRWAVRRRYSPLSAAGTAASGPRGPPTVARPPLTSGPSVVVITVFPTRPREAEALFLQSSEASSPNKEAPVAAKSAQDAGRALDPKGARGRHIRTWDSPVKVAPQSRSHRPVIWHGGVRPRHSRQ